MNAGVLDRSASSLGAHRTCKISVSGGACGLVARDCGMSSLGAVANCRSGRSPSIGDEQASQ